MKITPQALDFLFENRLKDSKEWYKEHKDIHTKLVVEPFREFVVNITPYMNEIDPAIICNPKKYQEYTVTHASQRINQYSRTINGAAL